MSDYAHKISMSDKATNEERFQAIINLLNWLLEEMSKGRVLNNKIELQNNINSTEQRLTTPLSIAFVKMAEKGDIDEITASENASLFLEWKTGVNYKANTLLQYEGLLYRVLQEHTTQENWKPNETPSLYKVLGINENGIMEWAQPISSSDAYNTGDEVMFNGIHYRSLIDNNVWSPESYPAGWEVVTETIESPNSGDN